MHHDTRSLLCGVLTGFVALAGACNERGDSAPTGAASVDGRPAGPSYAERRRSFRTTLVHAGPAPQAWSRERPPRGVTEITYPSGDFELRAWLAVPPDATRDPSPALVYFHGGFAFGAVDFDLCRPFLDAGFVVMCPMLRGENGNPGRFELMLGEVDDAGAAVQWLARQPFVDRQAIYTFGHSVGGGVSALLSLRDDLPIRHGGSCGGLYTKEAFDAWRDFVPFDLDRAEERSMRVLLGHTRDMKRAHHAYVGRGDGFSEKRSALEREARGEDLLLELIEVPGDHHASLRPAMAAYLRLVLDAEAARAP